MSRSSRRASSSPTLPTAACSTVLFRGVSAATRRQREHYNQRTGASACGSSRRISAGRSTRCRCIGRQSIGSCLCRVSCPRVHLNRADGGGSSVCTYSAALDKTLNSRAVLSPSTATPTRLGVSGVRERPFPCAHPTSEYRELSVRPPFHGGFGMRGEAGFRPLAIKGREKVGSPLLTRRATQGRNKRTSDGGENQCWLSTNGELARVELPLSSPLGC